MKAIEKYISCGAVCYAVGEVPAFKSVDEIHV